MLYYVHQTLFFLAPTQKKEKGLAMRETRVSEMKFRVLTIFLKFYIQPPVSVFLFLTLHLMLDGLILFCKGDFRRVRSF